MKKYQKPSLQIVSLAPKSEIAAGGFFGKNEGKVDSIGIDTSGLKPIVTLTISSFEEESGDGE